VNGGHNYILICDWSQIPRAHAGPAPCNVNKVPNTAQ